MARAEPGFIAGAWGLLAVCSLLLFPVSPMPRQWGSWDAIHSGRRFAEQGFLANKFQPVWAPVDHPAAYLTYTHYPPLPQWGAGVVEMLSSSPQGRIDALHHTIRLLGLTALALTYVLLRQLGCGPAAAALVVAVTASSSWMWTEMTTQTTWCGWCLPLLLGSTVCFLHALPGESKRWKLSLAAGTVLSLAAALSAYQAWSWYPTFFGALVLGTGAAGSERRALRHRLLTGLLLATTAVALGVAIRVAINWWHFGSLETTLRDFIEAYQTRSIGSARGVQIEENRANYFDLFAAPRSRLSLLWAFAQRFPLGMLGACVPEGPVGGWVALTAFGLGGAGWLARRWATRGAVGRASAVSSPGPLATWLALLAAPLPFVVLCPAISAEDWTDNTFWMFPAWVVLFGFSLHFVLDFMNGLLARTIPGKGVVRILTLSAVILALGTTLASIRRIEQPDRTQRETSIAEAMEVVHALKDRDGVVYVNLFDHNPFMYAASLETRVVFRPIWILRSQSPTHVRLPDSLTLLLKKPFARVPRLPGHWVVVDRELPEVPGGWRVLELSRAGR